MGCLRNYRQILGESVLLWLWPQPMQGSGTEFEVTDDKDAATVWPPREYHTSKRQARTFVSEYASSSGVHRRGGSGAGGRGGKNRNMSNLSTPITPDTGLNQGGGRRSRVPSRESTTSGAAAPHFPTHVRRGSEGWIVQDLTVQQRADLYDRQLRYQQVHGQQQQAYSEVQAVDGEEEEDYQEGLSDIEGDVYSQLPGGMQGNRYEDYNDDAEYYDEEEDEEYASSDDADDLPYDVASDEWDENEYDEYDEDDDRYEDEVGSDLDQHNPYLAYADEEEEEGDYGEDLDVDDEVTLNGKDRHKIGRFFDNVSRSTGLTGVGGGGEEVDEWDEGEGIDVGCRPPGLMAKGVGIPETPYSTTAAAYTGQKTFYTMMLEREQALKEQIATSGDGSGGAVETKSKTKTKKKKSK